MATVTFKFGAYPGAGKVHAYTVTGLINGANALTLPAPPLTGSFDPSGTETPTTVQCIPTAAGAAGALVTLGEGSISNNGTGTISFTVYANGATDCVMFVW